MAQRLSMGLACSMFAPLCRRSQPEEPRPRPAGPGNLARHLREGAVARAAQQHTVRKHRHPMANSVPFSDQYAARRNLSCGRLGWWSPVDVVFRGPLEQAAGSELQGATRLGIEEFLRHPWARLPDRT